MRPTGSPPEAGSSERRSTVRGGRSALAVSAVVAAALWACAGQDPGTATLPSQGDLAGFRDHVQPVLAAGCASLDCHGVAGRPLRLYSRDGLRLAPDLRGLDATDDELRANMISIAGLDPEVDAIEDHLVLLKPLAVAAGGMHHVGGDLWPDTEDPAYRCLHAWYESGVSDPADQAACTAAAP